ncbi:hypothetical protein [Piscirickettsia salmonis]|uniref:hypothetical protein n=1 Tax=Piscirickettsia salmonis TaxID=1238 RepID=UPI0012B7E204|nr:hypothetical protein [Piscirickettsia salmonis]QHS25240.1 hypothetical protein GW538_03895 [Piscirickettsia salmonis]QHS28441.1 hypothetical protein GW537_03875 [Piscirickettsia salmonis]
MLGDFASLDVQNTYRGSDAYDIESIAIARFVVLWFTLVASSLNLYTGVGDGDEAVVIPLPLWSG